MKISGNDVLAKALARHRVSDLFYIMGGPTIDAAKAIIASGVRMIDVRHEQAAVMMAQAYARLQRRPGVCMAASGPGVINFTTGSAHALVDSAPIVMLGGASPLSLFGTRSFQEFDQVAVMKPVTKWSERVHEARRIPTYIDRAFAVAMSGQKGPVYLDLPGDVLNRQIDEDSVEWPSDASIGSCPRPGAAPHEIETLRTLLQRAQKPIILSGSGIIWSDASEAMQRFVEASGIPFFTTPQGRGVVPDDHPLSFLSARSTALKQADLVIVLGTRLNYIWSQGSGSRFNPDARFVQVDIDPEEIARTSRLNLGIVADVRTFLEQASNAVDGGVRKQFAPWVNTLAGEVSKRSRNSSELDSDEVPIHPLRLCREVRDFMDRDAVLVVDGQEILNYGRQSIPTFVPGHRLNSGTFGTMGVGLPFGVGAKAAKPDSQVIVLHGDGSFGWNAMELDTAVRHKLPILVIISLNGGMSSDPERNKPGRDLGYTRFDLMAQSLGCHGEFVERPEDIRPALERGAAAVKEGRVAVVNVVTDWRARATTMNFTQHMT